MSRRGVKIGRNYHSTLSPLPLLVLFFFLQTLTTAWIIGAVMGERARMVLTVIPVTAPEDIPEITVKQVNCCFGGGFNIFLGKQFFFASYCINSVNFNLYFPRQGQNKLNFPCHILSSAIANGPRYNYFLIRFVCISWHAKYFNQHAFCMFLLDAYYYTIANFSAINDLIRKQKW